MGSEGIKPRFVPKALNPKGSKAVTWAKEMESVVGEGAGPAPDEPEDNDDVVELTIPAPGEGVEGGHEDGGHPGSLPEPPFPSGLWIGGRNT